MTRQSYQQGHISGPHDTRGGKAFRIRYRVRNSDGKWKQRSEMLYGLSGKKEARSILDMRVRECSTSTADVSELTLRSFVEGYWKPYLERKSLKPSTRKNYDSALENHILPVLGDHRIREICPMHIEQFVQAKSKADLSGKTVRNLVLLLQGIYSLAMDNDLVVKSPIRKSHKPVCRRKEKPIWSPETIAAILREAPQPYCALFYCVALTGVRQGELLGLQWKHINLATRKLRIEQSLWQGQLVAPKTVGSVRTICLGNVLTEVLAAHFQQTAHKAPEDFVFCTKEGSPLHPDVVRKDVLYPILDRLRIARTPGESGFHTFRHSAASILNERTGNLKLTQRMLGHSNISTTADVYTHISEESEREAALTVEEAICGCFVPNLFPTGNKTSNAGVN